MKVQKGRLCIMYGYEKRGSLDVLSKELKRSSVGTIEEEEDKEEEEEDGMQCFFSIECAHGAW